MKYAKCAQPPMAQADEYWSALQNNNTNAYYVELGAGTINNNNKNNAYVTRACQEDAKYHISFESLIEAYYDCRRNKRTKNECVRFEYNRERTLIELHRQIEAGEYIPSPSKAFIVDYPVNREVFAADFVDRIVHHWTALRLEPLMEKYFIDDSYNCRKGKGTTYGINRTTSMLEQATKNWTETAYVAKWDYKGYFMSIRKDVLLEMAQELVDAEYNKPDKDALMYLVRCTILNEPQNNCIRTSPCNKWDALPIDKSLFNQDTNLGLPIGNLTSQLFANFYLWKVDKEIKARHKFFCRYVDDGWIIDTDRKKILQTIRWLRVRLRNLGVRLHPRKFYFQRADKGMKVIGVVMKPHRTYVANRTIGRALQRLQYYNSQRPSEEGAKKLQSSVNSYLGLMNQYRAYGCRVKLCKSIKPEWFEYIAIVNNYNKIKLSRYEHKFDSRSSR